jgi:hypothetical protein
MGSNGTNLYVAGLFSSISGQSNPGVAAFQLSNGAYVTGFAPAGGADNAINALVATSTSVYIGGYFQNFNSTARPNLAALDASTGALQTWAPAVTGTGTSVSALVSLGTNIYVGGSFTGIND